MDASELLDAIRENLDDPERYLVYSDFLQERGDPLGELIAVDVALEEVSKAHRTTAQQQRDALLRAHGPTLFAGLWPVLQDYVDVTWRRGFVDGLRFEGVRDLRYQRQVGWLIERLVAHRDRLPLLRVLSFPGTDLSDLRPLACFKELRELDLTRSSFRRVEQLELFEKLERVRISRRRESQSLREQIAERFASLAIEP